jgi:RecJ-like exonuclease
LLQAIDPIIIITLIGVILGIILTVLRIYYYSRKTKELNKKQVVIEEKKEEKKANQIFDCPLCQGNGIYQEKKCSACKGIGKIKASPNSVICGTCRGTGLYMNREKCKICKGRGRIPAYYIKTDD